MRMDELDWEEFGIAGGQEAFALHRPTGNVVEITRYPGGETHWWPFEHSAGKPRVTYADTFQFACFLVECDPAPAPANAMTAARRAERRAAVGDYLLKE